VVHCPFGSLECSTSFGDGCQDGGFRAFIDIDEQAYGFTSGSTGESYGDVVIEVDGRLIQGEDFSGAFVLSRDKYQENVNYFKVFHDGVANGTWTYEQGLIASLRVLAGETDVEHLLGESAPENAEATGVLLAPAPTSRAPPIRMPGPRSTDCTASSYRTSTACSPIHGRSRTPTAVPQAWFLSSAESEACAKLPADGLRRPRGGGLTCYVYLTTPSAATSRVFCRESWGPSDPRLAYAHASGQVIVAAYQVFSAIGTMKAVDLVFTLHKCGGKESPETPVDSLGGQSACNTIVFPIA
jgi:hypothetical protein